MNTYRQIWANIAEYNNPKQVVFTNGCFDVLHYGHFALLQYAKAHGTFLVVGVNSDESVKRLKGEGRPIFGAYHRLMCLKGIECVDAAIEFNEDTPQKLIEAIEPDILIKGGDYKNEIIAGEEFVLKMGGEVIKDFFVEGFSTTKLLENLKK